MDEVLPLQEIAETLAIFAMGGAVEPRCDQRANLDEALRRLTAEASTTKRPAIRA